MRVPRLFASAAAGGLAVMGIGAAGPALASTHGTAEPLPIHQINSTQHGAPLGKRVNSKVAATTGNNILIYGPSLNGSPNNEETLAEAAGYGVTVVDASAWDSMTTAQFSSYRAIVFGDPTCGSDPSILNPALSNQSTWAPAVTGPTVVIGTAPVFHQSQSGVQADQLITDGINFAASSSGTGLYADLSCYYVSSPPNTSVPLLSPFGTFTVEGPPDGCNNVDIVDPSSPVVADITNSGLANWRCSAEEMFDSYPSSFSPVVDETDSSPPLPYIIAAPAKTYALSVTKSGTGSATITSTPAGINCGTSCSANYPPGTSVTLTETPAAGTTFAGWNGACVGMAHTTCTVTMNSNESLSASFTGSSKLYQQDKATYQGNWNIAKCSCFSGGTDKYTTVKGSNAQFTFTGKLIQFVSEQSVVRGSFKVYIDGVFQATVSDYSTTTRNAVVVWQHSFTKSATHTLKIVNVGTSGHNRIDVDAFIVGT